MVFWEVTFDKFVNPKPIDFLAVILQAGSRGRSSSRDTTPRVRCCGAGEKAQRGTTRVPPSAR